MKKTILLLSICALPAMANAQDFDKKLKQHKAQIEQAFKSKTISEGEYEKLLKEHESIKETMYKYKNDGYFSSSEKNKINSKLNKASSRMKKYKRNKEIY